jgi:hypothetical protein
MTRSLRRMASAVAFAVIGACMTGADDARAQGGPPLLTDDPGTPGAGNWEINFAWTSQNSASTRYEEAPLVDINYGVGERLQLKFEMPWVIETGRGNNGFGNALVGVKWRFFDQGDDGWQVSTYPQIEFLPPALHHAGSTTSGVGYLLPIEIEHDFGAFGVDAEFGRTFAPAGGDDGWIAGLALGYKVSERTELVGEVHDETFGGWDAHELIVDIGARRTLSEHFTLLVSLGSDIDNSIGPRNQWVSYLGLQLHP